MAADARAADGRLDARPVLVPTGRAVEPGILPLDVGTGAEALLAVPPGPVETLLVFFHGAGGTAAHSLAAVSPSAEARGVAVLAPSSVSATWDLLAGGLGRDVAVLDAALEQVLARLPVARVALAGFSDGGSYALSLGVANGDLAEAVLAFSPGFVAAPGRYGRPRFWVSHGIDDQVLPVARCGRQVALRLREDGYDVAYQEFAGGHVIPPALVTAALGWWLDGA